MPKNTTLLKLRNEKIYERYKELYDIKFLRHEKVLEVLSTDFYLETQSLQKIIVNQRKLKTVAEI